MMKSPYGKEWTDGVPWLVFVLCLTVLYLGLYFGRIEAASPQALPPHSVQQTAKSLGAQIYMLAVDSLNGVTCYSPDLDGTELTCVKVAGMGQTVVRR